MARQFFSTIIRFRIICIITVILLSVLAASQLPKLKFDNSNESFFVSGDYTKQRLDQFKATFGNDDFVFVLVEFDQPLTLKNLLHVSHLAKKLEKEVPHLLELTWIGNVESIKPITDGIAIEPFISSLDISESTLQKHIQQAASDPMYQGRLISADGKALGLLMEFENYPESDTDPRKDSPPIILEILETFDDLNLHIVGGPIMDYVMNERTSIEAPTWMISALLGMCLILAITTRSIIGILVPATTVLLSVLWTMGIVSALGFTLNLLVILVPSLMLCVGIGDTMHVVAEVQQKRQKGSERLVALNDTLTLVSQPLVLTTLTTAIGFLAFLFIDIVPLQHLGIQAAMGVVIALFLTYFFAVPILSFGSQAPPKRFLKSAKKNTKPDIFDRLISGICSLVIHRKVTVCIVFIVITIIALFGINRLVIETNTIQDMPKDEPLRVAFTHVDNTMGGAMSIEFVIDTGKADGIKDITLLQDIDKLQEFLNEHPLVTQTWSVLDQIKQMHRAIHNGDEDYYRLPDSSKQIAEYLLLYESGGGSQLEQFVSFTSDKLRVQARTKTIKLAEIKQLQASIDDFVKKEFTQNASIYVTGTLAMFERIATLITEGQTKSLLFALLAVTAFMILALRSITLGLIAVIPNVLPVIFALGGMGWLGASLNMFGMVLAPMIIGVAVDDTVHFFVRYRSYFAQYKNYDASYRETLRTVGRPLLFTTLVLVAGFSGFAQSIFAGPRNFSWSSMMAFSAALLTVFMLVPILLAWLKPLGPETQETKH